jgi:hypothetical protein
MCELKDRMTRDLELRNLAAGTRYRYLRCCSDFVRYHMMSALTTFDPPILTSIDPGGGGRATG